MTAVAVVAVPSGLVANGFTDILEEQRSKVRGTRAEATRTIQRYLRGYIQRKRFRKSVVGIKNLAQTEAYVTTHAQRKQQASAVKNANDTRKFILDADEEAVILSNNPSKVKTNQLTNRISAENRVTKNEVVEYDSSDLKYGHSPLESADHNPTDYSVPKADHTKEYTFGSDNYETTEYKFES